MSQTSSNETKIDLQKLNHEDIRMNSQQMKSLAEVESIITRAIAKVDANKETQLCHYIPGDQGGYMHHFTLKKMKTKQPEQLCSLLKEFIIQSDRPRKLPPKRRAPRGSRKKRDQCAFPRGQLEKMLQLAKSSGSREMVKEVILLLNPKKSTLSCKKELISSIRRGEVDQDLWETYVEAVKIAQENSQEVFGNQENS